MIPNDLIQKIMFQIFVKDFDFLSVHTKMLITIEEKKHQTKKVQNLNVEALQRRCLKTKNETESQNTSIVWI